MKESYGEGVANHTAPSFAESLERAMPKRRQEELWARKMSREIPKLQDADALTHCGRPHPLQRIRKLCGVTALMHHVYNIETLRWAYWQIKRQAAPGVDGVTWQHYGEDLEQNLQDLSHRLRRGAYQAKPVRRVYIPKADGRLRPLGVTALEDKLVQRATVEVLNSIYETDFFGFSYGFRPGRNQHNLKEEGASLDFLGFTYRYDRDQYGRERKYLNVMPSAKALKRERAKLHEMTDRHQCFKPLPVLIEELNRQLQGWKNCFNFGYPRKALRQINTYVRERLTQHMRRRSQRPFRPPEGETYYHYFQRKGLVEL